MSYGNPPGLVLLLLACAPAALFSCVAEQARVPGDPSETETVGLENVHLLAGGLISGGEPKGDAGYESLRRLGVRSLISTDAVAPDLDRARAAGIRVVHLPIGYDGIAERRQIELAAAIRDLPRPIYVHCHHGKHRGPAAICVGAIGAGEITREDGSAFMELAGTSRSYPGLWRDAEGAEPLDDRTLDGVAGSLPEADTPEGTARVMASLDRAHERLWLVADNGWTVPEEHPDLAPVSDAGLVRDLLRSLKDAEDSLSYGRDYIDRLEESAGHAAELEAALAAGDSRADSDATQIALEALLDSCISCHSAYRN